MKKMIALVLMLICVIALVGCANQKKEQPLVSLMPTQKMIEDIAAGNLEKAWYPVYNRMADPELKENLELYAEMFAGREVKRCDCYDYERTGERSTEGSDYTEITYYKIYLTEDYYEEPDYYAKAVHITDGEGTGTISLEIYEEAPQR